MYTKLYLSLFRLQLTYTFLANNHPKTAFFRALSFRIIIRFWLVVGLTFIVFSFYILLYGWNTDPMRWYSMVLRTHPIHIRPRNFLWIFDFYSESNIARSSYYFSIFEWNFTVFLFSFLLTLALNHICTHKREKTTNIDTMCVCVVSEIRNYYHYYCYYHRRCRGCCSSRRMCLKIGRWLRAPLAYMHEHECAYTNEYFVYTCVIFWYFLGCFFHWLVRHIFFVLSFQYVNKSR